MISGNTRVNLDAPPFCAYSGYSIEPKGLNLVGLKRAGFDLDQVAALKKAYVLLYRSGLGLDEALRRIAAETPTEHTLHLVRFIESSKRGICRIRSRSALRED
jgi:UDP-N-acetylglucosamine acyltransferase